ncbi:MAG: PQQ-dependent dehydrogenase, methanol/ethanol family [Myxococcota bacterium]|nr:PQQ-dependent dehydrogenase, methanol/ethanol family [Myxococcota bacterium]
MTPPPEPRHRHWPRRGYGARLARLILLLALAHAVHPATLGAEMTGVNHRRIVGADAEPGNWLSHGRTYAEERHSPLRDISTENIDELGLAWAFDLGEPRGLEATPLALDGTLYFTGTWSVVYAVDGATGELLWRYDPRVPRSIARQACCDVVNRGVAAWGDKIFVGTLDGRLIALDASTGEAIWDVMTVDPEQPYTITGAPRVIQGRVMIGNGGAEFGVRGYISAYSAETGELDWRFYTVPGNPADGFESETLRRIAETWNGEWWKVGGGGTVWDSMAYDPELDLLYIGVGNGSPWNRRLRSPGGGDNLFLASIVALRPATGEYVWHYQVVPAETWDFTATQHMILADIDWQGSRRKVLMQAPKSGFFIILDRETGEFLSAEPFAEITWASHYDPITGRPVENPGEDYAEGSVTVQPASVGAHNWQPMAYDPETGLVFIPAIESRFTYKGFDTLTVEKGLRNLGVDRRDNPPGDALFLSVLQKRLISGRLLAWDPRRQQTTWSIQYPLAWNGGVLATAGGLVFHGSGEGVFHAYDAGDGEELWRFPSQTGIIAAPISYRANGEQYIAVLAGWGGSFGLGSGMKPAEGPAGGRLLAFKLGGKAQLPALPEPASIPRAPAPLGLSEPVLAHGGALYANYCAFCHGAGMVAGGAIPDLRRLGPGSHDNFQAIVRLGALEGRGMPRFGDIMSEDDVRAIQAFVIEKANEDQTLREEPGWWHTCKLALYEFLGWLFMLFIGGTSSSA